MGTGILATIKILLLIFSSPESTESMDQEFLTLLSYEHFCENAQKQNGRQRRKGPVTR